MSFAHLLKRVDFDAIVDHLALVHILKSKTEPATTRIKRLLEVLSAYSFNLYYMKGKDMILSDILSRQMTDNSNTHEIIHISFDMQAILKDGYYNVGSDNKYLVQMCSEAKASGVKVSEVHSVDKGINSDIEPERQVLKSQSPAEKPKLGQGREGLRREMKAPAQVQLQVQFKEENHTREQAISKQRKGIQTLLTRQTNVRHIEQRPETGTMPEHLIRPKVTEIKIPIYPDPLMKPPPRPPDIKAQDDQKINLDIDLEINKDLINTNNIVQKYLPKQT